MPGLLLIYAHQPPLDESSLLKMSSHQPPMDVPDFPPTAPGRARLTLDWPTTTPGRIQPTELVPTNRPWTYQTTPLVTLIRPALKSVQRALRIFTWLLVRVRGPPPRSRMDDSIGDSG